MSGTIYLHKVMLNDFHDTSYLANLPVVRNLQWMGELTFESPVTFFVGENGSGKSTLLEALAISAGYNAEGGSRNFSFATKSTESNLHSYITLSRRGREKDGFFYRAESFYNVASQVENLDLNLNGYGGKSLHAQSHGESLLALVQNRFRGDGLYILDEPEAALSPLRQMTLMLEIRRLVNEEHSQFLIATHSPILITFPGADIFEVTCDAIEKTTYEKTASYQITKRFLENPQHMLDALFDE
jgi:predicted ATPase